MTKTKLAFALWTTLAALGCSQQGTRQAGQKEPAPPKAIHLVARGSAAAGSSETHDLSRTNLPTRRLRDRVLALRRELDPRRDGWDTEALTEVAEAQFKKLAQTIASPTGQRLQAVRAIAAPGFQCAALRPRSLREVWKSQRVRVFRPHRPAMAKAALAPAFQGPDGLGQAVQALAAPLERGHDVHVKFKVYRTALRGPAAVTRVYFSASAQGTPHGAVQLNAAWRCRWRRPAEDSELQLESIEVTDYQEVVSAGEETMLSDCTEHVLAKNDCFRPQLCRGLNHWARRIDGSYRIGMAERYGLALGDVNGDGLEDVYVCQPSGLPNRLFVQSPVGTAVDRSSEAGVDWLDQTASALFVDLDNDGDQDLALATPYGVVLMANDGSGKFHVKKRLEVKEWDLHALSAADYDNDGDLDLFVCVASAEDPQGSFVYHDARNGGANFLFRNDLGADSEAWTFSDVTAAVGLGADNHRHTLAAAWEDYDDDGDQDLYLANDYGINALYRNEGGRFVNVAKEAGVLDPGSGMSVSWGDFNRDGRMDLYVANMFSSAGNRITYQQSKLADMDSAKKALLQRFAKGNSLFENTGGGQFREVGDVAGVEVGRWAWGSLFADINNDGWEDLLVANGFITNDDPDDL